MEYEGTQVRRVWGGGCCLHIRTLPLTPRKSSNLPYEVLQFNFSIVRGDNPLIIEAEVALSPGQGTGGSQRAPVSSLTSIWITHPLLAVAISPVH